MKVKALPDRVQAGLQSEPILTPAAEAVLGVIEPGFPAQVPTDWVYVLPLESLT